MTTIAYARGLMAADSSAWVGEVYAHKTRKLWRVGGGLVGMAGSLIAMEAFVRWIADGAHEDDYPLGDYDAIVVDPRGRVSLYEGAGPDPVVSRDPYIAIGSGMMVALGALHAGADARAAVRAAIRHTGTSKPPVKYLQLREVGK